MKKILFMTLAVISLMSSCKREEGNGDGNGNQATGETAYLTLNLAGLQGTVGRSVTEPGVAGGEDAVNDVHILLFDGNDKFQDIKTFSKADLTTSGGSYKTTPFVVPVATKKVFVIVNNKQADGVAPRFTMPSAESDLGKDWSVLNQTLKYTPAATDDVNEFVKQITGKTNMGNFDNFTMANYGDRTAGDNGLVAVVTGSTPSDASTKANVIYVDRLASKIGFKITEVSAGTGEIAALPANAKFFFQGWQMNATNRYMRLYSPHEENYTGANPIGGMLAYRKDANYTEASYGVSGSAWTGFENQFVFLKNIGIDGIGATSSVDLTAGAIQYCPENTMEASAQMQGATTKVVVKGNYVPAINSIGGAFTKDASYFRHGNIYYTLADLKTAYTTSVAAGGHNQGLAKDMDAFMKAALFMEGAQDPDAPTDLEYETAVAALTDASFNANTGIIARTSTALRYFHQGVSYYSVLIRHDQRISDNNALAKYGTVRNNWYELNLSKVSKPGTPWIPGGPDDPTTNPETPDDTDADLDVTITINQWITWQQGIEL